jgi:peroxiredoxin (alkyl hydroperoxide reductase subunit C)
MLQAGVPAPDFTLENQSRQRITLSDFRGRKNVVLAFHPLAFTPVCSVQMQNYQKALPTFESLDTVVLGISFDLGPSHAAWANSLGGLSFDLLSDVHPHAKVARAYGVFREGDGLPDRAIFVVDKKGIIRWAKHHEIPEQPELEQLIGRLRAL